MAENTLIETPSRKDCTMEFRTGAVAWPITGVLCMAPSAGVCAGATVGAIVGTAYLPVIGTLVGALIGGTFGFVAGLLLAPILLVVLFKTRFSLRTSLCAIQLVGASGAGVLMVWPVVTPAWRSGLVCLPAAVASGAWAASWGLRMIVSHEQSAAIQAGEYGRRFRFRYVILISTITAVLVAPSVFLF